MDRCFDEPRSEAVSQNALQPPLQIGGCSVSGHQLVPGGNYEGGTPQTQPGCSVSSADAS
jgi:hypothetical protein